MPAACLLKRRLQVAACSPGYDLEAIGIGFSHTERASPDRASGSQDGNAFHAHSQKALSASSFISYRSTLRRNGQSNLVAPRFLGRACRAPPTLTLSQHLD